MGNNRGVGCHAEPIRCAQGKLPEGSLAMGSQMLRCAQHDTTGFGRSSSLSAPTVVRISLLIYMIRHSGLYSDYNIALFDDAIYRMGKLCVRWVVTYTQVRMALKRLYHS